MMTLTDQLIDRFAAQTDLELHAPAYRKRVQAAGELVALSILEAEALPGSAIVAHLTDLARSVPGNWAAYPLLHTLEAAGHVTATAAPRSPQRTYAITESGRIAAASLRACLLPDSILVPAA